MPTWERITEHRSAVSVRRRRHCCEMLGRTGERHAPPGVPSTARAAGPFRCDLAAWETSASSRPPGPGCGAARRPAQPTRARTPPPPLPRRWLRVHRLATRPARRPPPRGGVHGRDDGRRVDQISDRNASRLQCSLARIVAASGPNACSLAGLGAALGRRASGAVARWGRPAVPVSRVVSIAVLLEPVASPLRGTARTGRHARILTALCSPRPARAAIVAACAFRAPARLSCLRAGRSAGGGRLPVLQDRRGGGERLVDSLAASGG